jgi:hypothetical protein
MEIVCDTREGYHSEKCNQSKGGEMLVDYGSFMMMP